MALLEDKFFGGVRKHWGAPRQMPALCRHSVDVLMQISPQGLCAHGQGRGQELHSTSSGDYPRILWHCSRLQSWWKTRESSFSYQNLGCCDPGLRGLWGENTKSVCWDGPGRMQEVLGQPTASGGRFPGNATPHLANSQEKGPIQALQVRGWYGKYFLQVLCQTAKSYTRGNWQGQGKEQKK